MRYATESHAQLSLSITLKSFHVLWGLTQVRYVESSVHSLSPDMYCEYTQQVLL